MAARAWRVVWLVVLSLPVALGLIVSSSGSASAHAELDRTEPVQGAVLTAPPRVVVLHFTEPVSAQFATVRVAGPDGGRVDTGTVRVRGSAVTAALRGGQADGGTYTVVWRVVADDNHPISGRFSFAVGVPAPLSPAAQQRVERTVAAAAVPVATRVLLGVGRLVEYAGFILFAGTLALVAWAWPEGADVDRVRRLAWAGWLAAAAGTALTLLMQGPDAAAAGPSSVLSLLGDVLRQRFGLLHVARLAALAAVTPGLALGWAARARRSPRHGVVLAATLGFLAATWSLAGHAGTRPPAALSVSLDAVHLVAVASWLGGLVVVSAALLAAADAVPAAARWSQQAFASVLALVATGSWAAVDEVGSVSALTGSEYGRLLSAKVALVAVMVGLGGVARIRLQRHGAAALRRTVRVEAALGAAVLALASLLVATAPGRVSALRGGLGDQHHGAQVASVLVAAPPAQWADTLGLGEAAVEVGSDQGRGARERLLLHGVEVDDSHRSQVRAQ